MIQIFGNNCFNGTDNVIGYVDIEPEIDMFFLHFLFLYGAALPQPWMSRNNESNSWYNDCNDLSNKVLLNDSKSSCGVAKRSEPKFFLNIL